MKVTPKYEQLHTQIKELEGIAYDLKTELRKICPHKDIDYHTYGGYSPFDGCSDYVETLKCRYCGEYVDSDIKNKSETYAKLYNKMWEKYRKQIGGK